MICIHIKSKVIINFFRELNDSLKYLFEKSLKKGFSQDDLEIAGVLKGGNLKVGILILPTTIDPPPFLPAFLRFSGVPCITVFTNIYYRETSILETVWL